MLRSRRKVSGRKRNVQSEIPEKMTRNQNVARHEKPTVSAPPMIGPWNHQRRSVSMWYGGVKGRVEREGEKSSGQCTCTTAVTRKVLTRLGPSKGYKPQTGHGQKIQVRSNRSRQKKRCLGPNPGEVYAHHSTTFMRFIHVLKWQC